ncbi:phosphate signaling complex protein PhoU [Gryllotalpicola reticulitermitis]|uniref:Phosphate-specific transport system accessory protein PhoU n=1 Tax=Gryllotalpicola reticulitermitis TaxID=1184153 RepID=A0ABV8Q723_9MICO
MRAVFQQELSSVQDGLVLISDLVLDAIRNASTAFNTADIALADQVISGDPAIDRLSIELDELSIQILARQGPVARDLRVVVGALRMSALLERMGDLARHLAQLTRRHYPEHVAPDALRDIFIEMAAQDIRTAELLNRLLRTQDLELAEQLIEDDARTDALHRSVFDAVLRADWTGTTEQTVDVTLATRFFERFGDQAVSIAKRAQYLSTGEWVMSRR